MKLAGIKWTAGVALLGWLSCFAAVAGNTIKDVEPLGAAAATPARR